MKKKLLAAVMAGTLVFSLAGCAGGSDKGTETKAVDAKTTEAKSTEAKAEDDKSEDAKETESRAGEEKDTASAEGKQDLVIMITNPGDVNNAVEQKIIEKFGDKYNIITKTWDSASVEQTVKTAAAANEQMDLVQYWPNQMNSFTEVGLATDLTEYMDAEWRSTFNEGTLEIGTYDEKLYNVAYKTVYPAMAVDLEVTRAAGIEDSEIKEQMTWEEFCELCRRIEENSDAYGAGIPDTYACWLTRNAVMQVWDTNEQLDKWNAGEVSFKDDKIKSAFEMVKSVFDEGLFYPGEGALAVTQDQLYGAISSHKVGFIFEPTTSIKTTIDNSGLKEYKICDYPAMGKNPTNPVLGGCDGYFIPTSSKNVEGAIEVMKYLTSEEIMTFRAEGGQVPCAKIAEGAKVDEAFMESISRCSEQIYPTEIINIGAELSDYMQNQMPANYIYNGDASLDEMEELRLGAVNK